MATPAKKVEKRPEATSEVVHVRLPQEAIDRLDKIAKKKFTSRNAIIQIAISDLLESGFKGGKE